MLNLYFDNNAVRRHNIEQWLLKHNILFQSYTIDELTQADLLRFFTKTEDCFSLLKRTSWHYKLDNKTTMKSFVDMILMDKKKYLDLPLLETTTMDFNKFCNKLKKYRSLSFLPPQNWIEAMADIFEVDVNELFEEKNTDVFTVQMS
jgi:hypothetical protein